MPRFAMDRPAPDFHPMDDDLDALTTQQLSSPPTEISTDSAEVAMDELLIVSGDLFSGQEALSVSGCLSLQPVGQS